VTVAVIIATQEAANISVEPSTRAAGTHTLPMQTTAAAVAPADKTKTLPAAVAAAAADDANLQRAHSARYPPEKRPESK